ncbi:hypothetical protein [Amycolatopsis sp. WQ 127309]|uniref:hypothetical protein n=1 Tax=Amycolatopsis sp. WQ 127309 TaxID=2932773 RepID=UPI001FF466EA|nr:hypothetical protein [Amycolatopsis sp. WQ 127309]UOZ10198.1 hypothetical protein MUY22_18825 [Amycolatopsis sp. WQ 127309]
MITTRAPRGLLSLPSRYIEFASSGGDIQTRTDRLQTSYQRFRDTVSVEDSDRDLAEQLARQALEVSVNAVNLLEDDSLCRVAHDLLHEIGAYVGGMFGCQLEADEEGAYWDKCTVSLAHRRFGFSVGMSHDVLCSICHEDIDECEHLLGRTYTVIAAKNAENKCTACGSTECLHEPGSAVATYAQPVLSEPTLREVTITPRPRDPLARLEAVEIATDLLIEKLGRNPKGKVLQCMKCLEPCSGFTEASLDDVE